MGDSIKEKVIDKAVEQIIEFVVGKTKQQIIDELTKNDLKKILFRAFKDFSDSNYFKSEFRNYTFNDDNGDFLYNNINSEDIKPSLPVKVLKEKVSDLVIRYFISDPNEKQELILNYIITKYIQSASLKIKLYDLLVQQQSFYEQTISQLEVNTKLLEDLVENKECDEVFKKTVMDVALKESLKRSVILIATYYLNFVQKMPATIKCNKDITAIQPYADNIKSTIEQIDNFVDSDFIKRPICILIRNQDSVDQFIKTGNPIEKKIEYAEFCEFYFKGYIINEIRTMLKNYEHYMPKDFILGLFELEKYMENDIFATGLNLGIKIDLSIFTIDVKNLKDVLVNIGQVILQLIYKLI